MNQSAASRWPSLVSSARTGPSGPPPSRSTPLIRARTGSAPARSGGGPQRVVQRDPRHHHAVPRVAAAGKRGQPGPVPGRAHRQQVRALPGVRHRHAEVVEQPDAARPDQVAARLVAREGGLVHQRHPGPAAGQHQRGDAAGRPGARHHHVEAPGRRRLAARHRATTTATASVPVAQVK